MSARRRRAAHPPMTAVAMPLDKLDVWLQGRTGAAATNLSMLDGFVTAIVAGPVSMDPPEWICPLLGVEIDAFNRKRYELPRRRSAYDRVLKRVGIQYWRISSTTAGMSW